MKSPEVSVIVQDTRSQRFSVLGEVMRPGSYPLSKPMTVLDALSLAGGYRDFAKSEKMFSDCPVMYIARNAPEKLNGRARRTTIGSIKLLNCEASTIYATIMPSSSANIRLEKDSEYACEFPLYTSL